MNDLFLNMDEGETMTNYFKALPAVERSLIKNILSLDSNLKQISFKICNQQIKIEKLKEKYLYTFRARNPDLRHLTVE